MFNSRRILFFSLALCTLMFSSLYGSSAFPQSDFVVTISSNIPDLRPHCAYNADEAQILTALFEGLFVYDPYSMDPVAALAESWTVSANGKEWVFKLRSDAFFSNNEPITAQTVRDSWMNLLDPVVSAPYASLFDCIDGAHDYRTGEKKDPKSVLIIAENAHTLRLCLSSPAEHLPKILCHHAFSVVHSSEFSRCKKKDSNELYRPISSGPFFIDTFSKEKIQLKKNKQYWDAENVALPSISILISSDVESITAKFNRGEIHWVAGSVLVDRILDPASIKVTPMFSTEYFFFRGTWGPWAKTEIRNALLLSIPWEELRANYLIPAKTLVFPIAGYPELAGVSTHDTEAAKRLLTEAGITDFSTIPPLEIRIPDSSPFIRLADILKKAWSKLGFTVVVNTIPYVEYYGSLRTNDYALGLISWIGDFADPLSFLEMFRPASSLNDSGWNNRAFEELILDASAQRVSSRRYEKLAEAEKLLLSEGMIIPVAHNPSLNCIDTNGIVGWYANALDIHPFKFIKFVQQKALPGVALGSR